MKREIPTQFEHYTPRFASAWAALTYALCALSLAWPALLGQFLVNSNSDQYLAGYAFREFAATYLRTMKTFPLWQPYLLGGMPFVGAMHGDIFYPTFLLRLLLPVDVGMSWGMIGHFFLCGLATYWFLRVATRMSFSGALVGGVAYMMTGFVSSLLSAGHDGKLFVNALLPVLLILLTWVIRDGKRWAVGALALGVGLTLLTPHPQLFEQVMLVAAAWALFLAFSDAGAGRLPRDVALRRLGLALGAVAVGMAIGAIQYLPVIEYQAWSPRATPMDYDIATTFSFPIEQLIDTYLPQFSGILNLYWGRNSFHFDSEYVGAAVLVLAFAGFGASTTDARRRFSRFWLGTGIVSLLWALGGSTPFFHLVYELVPKVKYFRAPSTIFYVTAFSIAVFAAAGTERALEGRISRSYLIAWLATAALIALLGVSGGLTNLAHALSVIPQTASRIDDGAADLKLGAIRSLLFVVATVGVIVGLGMRRISGVQGGALLAALCAFDLWTVERQYWGFMPAAKEIYASNPAVEYLRALKEPARVLELEDPSQPGAPHDPFLQGDGLMFYRIRSTLGYQGNSMARYDLFSSNEMLFSPTSWALTNTQYLLINNDSFNIPGAKIVAGPVPDAVGTKITLYKLPGDNSFAWLVPTIGKYAEQDIVNALRQPNFPARSVALVDQSSKVPGTTLTAIPAPLSVTAAATTYEPGHIVLSLSAPAPPGSALIVSENYYPGWTARVDGSPAAVERMDFVLIGVPLPGGAKTVELTFTSPAYDRGRAITMAAVLLAMVLVIGGAVADRRVPGPIEPARSAA